LRVASDIKESFVDDGDDDIELNFTLTVCVAYCAVAVLGVKINNNSTTNYLLPR